VSCRQCYLLRRIGREWHLADNAVALMFVRFWTKADNSKFWREIVCPLMTQQRHWLCTAALVLMQVLAPIKVVV
jgi:hypothetical protein